MGGNDGDNERSDSGPPRWRSLTIDRKDIAPGIGKGDSAVGLPEEAMKAILAITRGRLGRLVLTQVGEHKITIRQRTIRRILPL